MEENLMQRDTQGKFALKNEKHRSVRSLRLTDTTWTALGDAAKSLSLTRADWLEQTFRSNDYPHPSNTRCNQEMVSSHPQQLKALQPRNTRQEEEIRRLTVEVAQLHAENALLVEQLTKKPTQDKDLEALRERVLQSLRLGKQAPGYKSASSALNQFIQLLVHKLN